MADRPPQRTGNGPTPNRQASQSASHPGPEPRGELLAAIPRGDREEFRVSMDEYEGKPYLSLRVWERSRDGQWWPVKGKGTTVRVRELDDVIEALTRAASSLGGDRRQAGPNPRANHPGKSDRAMVPQGVTVGGAQWTQPGEDFEGF